MPPQICFEIFSLNKLNEIIYLLSPDSLLSMREPELSHWVWVILDLLCVMHLSFPLLEECGLTLWGTYCVQGNCPYIIPFNLHNNPRKLVQSYPTLQRRKLRLREVFPSSHNE